eukprot:5630725-Prymnesium_polylepis.1
MGNARTCGTSCDGRAAYRVQCRRCPWPILPAKLHQASNSPECRTDCGAEPPTKIWHRRAGRCAPPFDFAGCVASKRQRASCEDRFLFDLVDAAVVARLPLRVRLGGLTANHINDSHRSAVAPP